MGYPPAMALTLIQSQAIEELMLLLVDWLPGSSSPWTRIYTFADAATENQVGEFWAGGTKKPALSELLRLTYEHRRERFCPLVLAIVQRGVAYRFRKGNPVQRAEVERINGTIQKLRFKLPELWDPDFLDSLPGPKVESPAEPEPPSGPDPLSAMPALQERFFALHGETDHQARGLAFESLLHDLFAAWELDPSLSYRVTGEQIDGSFRFDGATYLLEAKWVKHHIGVEALYPFRQKVASKSAYTRGLFLAVEGFSTEGVSALGQGQEQRIILLDGGHLAPILASSVSLPALLAAAVRHLEQRGEPLLPHEQLTAL